MKKLLSLITLIGVITFSSCKYDDGALWDSVHGLEDRVARLEELCKQMNTNLSSLQTIVSALQNNDYITSVDPLTEDGEVIGYTITFAKSNPIVIYNGKDGADGANVVGVKKDTDGVYYWTLDGEFIVVDGQKIKAQGTDAITPKLEIRDGYWWISYNNGDSWEQLGKATGEDGKDGESIKITQDENNVYFTMSDNTVITIPKGNNSQFAIVFDTTDIVVVNGGESKTISYTIKGATENTVVKADAQNGWKVKVNAVSTEQGTITVTAPNPIVESEILVIAYDGSYRTVMVSLNCMQGYITTADNSVNVPSDGGRCEIKLTTNLDYTVDIPQDAQSWLSLAPDTRAMREDTIIFEVTPNDGIQRFATVALKDGQDKTLQTIIFQQQGGTCSEIHVETKGELGNVLTDYDYANIESLKITGVLNDVDFLFIYSMMPNLKDLDIAEVNIMTLPWHAFYNSTNVKNLILPNALTEVDAEMFYCSNLESIVIPASVETIGEAAFKGCSKLTTVTFEEGSQLKTIGGGYNGPTYLGVFSDCTSLTSIEIPASVETIGESAFKGCSKLASVTFEEGSQLKTIDGGYYSDTYFGAFSDCSSLTSIEIPASVETIGESAFQGCSKLANVTFEEGSQLKTIGGGGYYNDPYFGAFSDCSSLTSIEIPASVETIGESAFTGCSKLANVTFEEDSQLKTIGNYAFSGALTSIEIPASVETIGRDAFSDCSNLASVTFEEDSQLKTIGDSAFSAALTSIDIPASVETIGSHAFDYCYKLASVTFEEGSQLKAIYSSAFMVCTSLTSIEIPASVETIGKSAFKGCSNLTIVTFEKESRLHTIKGGNSYSYEDGAFANCTSLTLIEIPASVETIGESAFKGCSKLTTVTFEEGSQLKTIDGGGYGHAYHGAFTDCSSLTSIEIPASVETIGESAFKGCSKLASVTFEEGSQLKTIDGVYYSNSYGTTYHGAFTDCTSLTSIEIPASVETIGESAFKGCSNLTIVTFEEGSQLKTIGGEPQGDSGAFNGCVNLMTVDMSECTQVESITNSAFRNNSKLQLFKIGTQIPPKCYDRAFDGIHPYSILKVPSGCESRYRNADGWKEFESVTNLDE